MKHQNLDGDPNSAQGDSTPRDATAGGFEHGDPAHGGAARGNPAHGDPNSAQGDSTPRDATAGGFEHRDPAHGGSARGNPAHGDPAHGGAAQGNPAQGDPNSAQSDSTPPDATAGGFEHGDPAHGGAARGNPAHVDPAHGIAAQGFAPAVRNSHLVGLIGKDIQRSKSPLIHEREARELGLVLLYQLLDLAVLGRDVDALGELLASAELLGFAGLNITHPAKQAVIPLLHELSEEASAIGAVNTVKFLGGRRKGYNTDASGFFDSFRLGLPGASLQRVVQIGAGGAGAATAYAMLKLGAAHLTIVDVLPSRAAGLVKNLSQFFDPSRLSTADDAALALSAADGLVHATPMGMREHPGLPVAAEAIEPHLWVAEIVYFPLETELLRLARAKGCRTLDGGGMVVFQAASAFEIFTGQQTDRRRMLKHFREIPQD